MQSNNPKDIAAWFFATKVHKFTQGKFFILVDLVDRQSVRKQRPLWSRALAWGISRHIIFPVELVEYHHNNNIIFNFLSTHFFLQTSITCLITGTGMTLLRLITFNSLFDLISSSVPFCYYHCQTTGSGVILPSVRCWWIPCCVIWAGTLKSQ